MTNDSSFDREIRDALREYGDTIELPERMWDRVEHATGRARGPRRPYLLGVAAVATLVVAAGLFTLVRDAGDDGLEVVPPADSPATNLTVDAFAQGEWEALPAAPVAALADAAVWTGQEMIVWSPVDEGSDASAGAAYDPDARAWRTLANPPFSGAPMFAVWTGEDVLVWGGFGESDLAAYNPVRDDWRVMTDSPTGPGNISVSGGWTGRELVLLEQDDVFTNRAFAFAADTETWREIAVAEDLHLGKMLVVGGTGYAWDRATGLWELDVADGTWTGADSQETPIGFAMAWTGAEILGTNSTILFAYDPATDTWRHAARCARVSGAASALAGTTLLQWGGVGDEVEDGVFGSDGVAIDTETGACGAMPGSPLSPRFGATGVWTGREFIVWGGVDGSGGALSDGAALVPRAEAVESADTQPTESTAGPIETTTTVPLPPLVPGVTGLDVAEATAALEAVGLTAEVVGSGDGSVTWQEPPAGASATDHRVRLWTCPFGARCLLPPPLYVDELEPSTTWRPISEDDERWGDFFLPTEFDDPDAIGQTWTDRLMGEFEASTETASYVVTSEANSQAVVWVRHRGMADDSASGLDYELTVEQTPHGWRLVEARERSVCARGTGIAEACV